MLCVQAANNSMVLLTFRGRANVDGEVDVSANGKATHARINGMRGSVYDVAGNFCNVGSGHVP